MNSHKPKFWHLSYEDKIGFAPLNEDIWFWRFQPLLLRLANTDTGRDLLCLEKHPFPIVELRKNTATYFLGEQDGQYVFRADIRVGAKWANVIRYRWQEFVRYAIRYGGWNQPLTKDWNPSLAPIAATATLYPDAHTETSTVDGGSRHTDASGPSWTTFVNAAGNGVRGDSEAEEYYWLTSTRASVGAWNEVFRYHLGFDSSGLAASATITSAVMSLRGTAIRNTLSASPVLELYATVLASNTAIVAGDYDGIVPATSFATGIAQGSFNTSGYNDWTLNSSGLAHITKAVDNFCFIDSAYDAPDESPTHNGVNDQKTDFKGYQADQSGTSSDPKLVITYTLPTFIPRSIIF